MTFAAAFKEVMARAGKSQRDIARAAGITPESLSRILSPDYAFRPSKTIERLIEAAQATPDERLGLYQLAGIIPPEIVTAFSSSIVRAKAIAEAAKGPDEEKILLEDLHETVEMYSEQMPRDVQEVLREMAERAKRHQAEIAIGICV